MNLRILRKLHNILSHLSAILRILWLLGEYDIFIFHVEAMDGISIRGVIPMDTYVF